MSNILEVILNLVDNMTPGLEAASGAVDNLESSVENASASIDNIDSSNINEIEVEADSAGSSVEDIGAAAASAGSELNNVSSEPIAEVGNKGRSATDGVNSLGDALGYVKGGIIGVAAMEVVNVFSGFVQSAMDSVDAWNLLGGVLDQQGVSLDSAKSEIISLANEHGFLTKNVREATKVFTQAGMSYEDVTKSNGAMNAAMAISVATGRDLTDSSVQLQRAYMGNGRALKLLGIDIDDYKDKSTGLVNQEALNNAILAKLGNQLEEHSNSYAAASTRAANSVSKFETALGKLALPMVVPVLNAVTYAMGESADAATRLAGVIAKISQGDILGGLSELPKIIGENAATFLEAGNNIAKWLVEGLSSLADQLGIALDEMFSQVINGTQVGGAGSKLAGTFIGGFIQWMQAHWEQIAVLMANVLIKIIPLLTVVVLQIVAIVGLYLIDATKGLLVWVMQEIWNWVAQLPAAGSAAASNLVNSFISWASQLPGMLWGILSNALGALGSFAGSAAGQAASAAWGIVSALGNTLAGLPGQMYSWGMNALSSFVNGIVNAIPGLRDALNAVSALFPHSPPKEGPLSTIKPENMEQWMTDIMEAGNRGAKTFGLDGVVNSGSGSGTGSSFGGSSSITVIHDFKNVPSHIDTDTLTQVLKSGKYNPGLINALIGLLTKGQSDIKSNLGV